MLKVAATLALVGGLALSSMGFMSYPADEAHTRARFESFIGKSIGQISNETMRLPVNMYDDSEGRNFLFEFGQCTAMLKTRQQDQNYNADTWVVYGFSARGWCGAF